MNKADGQDTADRLAAIVANSLDTQAKTQDLARQAFADRSCSFEQDVREISRFSCMLFLSVRGFSDYAGPNRHSRNSVAAVLPSSISEGSRHPDPSAFRSSIARPTGTSGLRFTRHLTVPPARLEARMESLFSFPVGLFHPLQHAGLSRRSPHCRQSAQLRADSRIVSAMAKFQQLSEGLRQ